MALRQSSNLHVGPIVAQRVSISIFPPINRFFEYLLLLSRGLLLKQISEKVVIFCTKNIFAWFILNLTAGSRLKGYKPSFSS